MPAFKCEKCYKIFNLKTDLDRHLKKKVPCVEVKKIVEEKVKEIAEATVKNNDDIAKVKKFLDFCHNTLRDKEGIVGMKALSNIAMLLFLRFVNNSVKNGNIDLLNIEQYRKEEGSITEPFIKFKKYIKYCKFENIIKDGKYNNDFELNELPTMIEYIFRHILWHHPKTKNIFTDEIPTIKNDVTYEQILKQMDKINWDDMDIDVKGLAYEHFLKNEMGGGELGQFFTRREVVDYMISVIKPHIKETSTFIDPFMGTGGFVTHMFNELRNMYKKKNIPFTDEIKNKAINGIEKNPQTCLLALNNMLINMDMFTTNVKCDDSFRNYISDKYDICITNPPFGIKGLLYDDKTMFPNSKNEVKKNKYLPHKSNDAICLALQMIQFILNKDGIGAIVVPDGKQMSSEKEKSLIAVRKMLVEQTNLFQITKLPSGTFLPYTGVETMILFFKKGEKTKNIKFVKLDDKYITETLICNINVKKIIEKKYSLNYKLYVDNNKNLHTNITYKKISEIFEFEKGTIQSSKIDNQVNGKYSFVTGAEDYKFKKIDLIENCHLLKGENLFVSHRGNGDSRPVKYYNGECYYSDLLTLLKPQTEINIKFAYYYLKFNQKFIEDNYQKGACNKTLDFTLFGNMEFPVPPTEVQNLIVKELDSMYKQKESIQSANNEVNTFRKVQFEMLLSKCENVKNEKFGDICEINIGGTPSTSINEYYDGGDNKWVQISDMKTKYISDTKEKITNLGIENSSVKKIHKDDIMLSFKLSIGKVAVAKDVMYCNEAIAFFRGSEQILNEYLYHYFNSIDISEGKTGCLGNGSLNKESLKNLVIHLPSLQDQESIIKQMEKYDKLVELQQAQIEDIDTTIKARFEFHLNKCKESKNSPVQKTEETEPVQEHDESVENVEEKLSSSSKSKRPSNNIIIDEQSNKSTSSKKSAKSVQSVKEESETEEESDSEEHIVMVGNVECINENGNYYKFVNGRKGVLYAKTSESGKVILHKKPLVKKV